MYYILYIRYIYYIFLIYYIILFKNIAKRRNLASFNVTLILRRFIWERLFIASSRALYAWCVYVLTLFYILSTQTTCIALLLKVRIQIEKVAPIMRYSQIGHDRKNRVNLSTICECRFYFRFYFWLEMEKRWRKRVK